MDVEGDFVLEALAMESGSPGRDFPKRRPHDALSREAFRHTQRVIEPDHSYQLMVLQDDGY